MKKYYNCVKWVIMAMWNLINNYLTSKADFGDGRNTSILSLPDELIINILIRVPAQSVVACRAVCSAWRRVINTTHFTDMLLIRSTPVLLGRRAVDNYSYNTKKTGGWFVIDNFNVTNVKVTGVELSPQEYYGTYYNPRVQAVCDGLLILRCSTDNYVICNRITREEVAFSLRSCDEICGFYFHSVDKEYTLLICDKTDNNKYSLYGLGSKDRRRLVTSANFNLDTCGVATCGALFWTTSDSNHHNTLTVNTETILMFHLDSENFTVKDQPTDRYKRERRTQVKLLEIDQKLGCCDVYQKSVQVWILEDVENWKWCMRYLVDLRGVITNNNVDGYNPDPKTCVVAAHNGNMVLFRTNMGLLWYNLLLNKFIGMINTDTLRMTQRRDYSPELVSYTRSLVSLRKCNILPESPITRAPNEVIIRSTVPRLPDEVIINILSRVPAESVLACRAVCSGWHRMTNTPQFTEMHLIRSTPVILGRAPDKYNSYNWFSIDNFRFKQLKMTGVGFLRQTHKPRVQAVCDGLIIFRSSSDRYVICNPITREEVAFDLKAHDEICGFYFHRVQKEYTLLICQRSDTNKYSVYGLSSKDRRTLATSATFNLGCCEAATCGGLFWRISNCSNRSSLTIFTDCIIMFNVESENFTVENQPTDRYKREGRTQVKLLEIDGKLGCCDVYQRLIHVWILEDVENWKWCKRDVVDLNRVINIYVDKDMLDAAQICVVGTQNGNMLLFRSNLGLVWYNLGSNKVRKINTGTLDMTLVGLFPECKCEVVSITSSLVSLRERNILP